LNLLDHKPGRCLIAFAFYFAEGIPIGFIWWAMPTLLRQQGIGTAAIGSFTALLTLPWVFKFLWAPLIDVYRSPRFGFTRWIGLSQALMCLSLLPLVFIPLPGNMVTWTVLLFIHSLCAATQDVSVDALVINVVAGKEKGLLNGYMQAGMLAARSIFGGGVLIFTGRSGLPATIGLMILAVLATMLLLPFIKEPEILPAAKAGFSKFKHKLRRAFTYRRTWYGIGFALTAAAAFEATGAFAGPYFTDLGIARETIGFFFAVPVVISMLAGGLTGGYLCDRLSRKKAVTVFLAGFVSLITLIAVLGLTGTQLAHSAWIILFSSMYFFVGMFTAASYALFMDITDPALGATQFSTYMAATNGCESWVVYCAGLVAATQGYPVAFLIMCPVSLAGLFFLARIKNLSVSTPATGSS
jgi:MFS family permease